MTVDASALVALIRDEPDADRFFHALSHACEPKRKSAANYALARARRGPLLVKGNDFSQTDIAFA